MYKNHDIIQLDTTEQAAGFAYFGRCARTCFYLATGNRHMFAGFGSYPASGTANEQTQSPTNGLGTGDKLG